MINPERALQELLAFDGGDDLVLSVYLNLQPERQVRRSYRIAFEDLIEELQAKLDEPAREPLDREVAAVQAHLDAEVPRGRGFVAFSCSPRQLWQTFFLPVIVAEGVYLGRRPYVRPLLNALDEYDRYAVALVDKKEARLFTVYLGEIEEHERLKDFVPGHQDQGGWSHANYQRHHEVHVHQHLQRVIEELSVLLRRRPFDRLVLAGPDEITSELERRLSRPLRDCLVATFPGEIFAGKEEILQRTLAIERAAERRAEEDLVGEVLDVAAVGQHGVKGLAASLEAIWLGRVHQLVVAENLRQPGSECPNCWRLAPDRPASCTSCGASPTPLDDVVERAIERTLEEDGRVEIARGAPARRLAEEGGGIAALLRF